MKRSFRKGLFLSPPCPLSLSLSDTHSITFSLFFSLSLYHSYSFSVFFSLSLALSLSLTDNSSLTSISNLYSGASIGITEWHWDPVTTMSTASSEDAIWAHRRVVSHLSAMVAPLPLPWSPCVPYSTGVRARVASHPILSQHSSTSH